MMEKNNNFKILKGIIFLKIKIIHFFVNVETDPWLR
jgi:hypothetical protein